MGKEGTLKKGIRWRIGDGKKVKIWEDPRMQSLKIEGRSVNYFVFFNCSKNYFR